MTRGYKWGQGVTEGYKGLRGGGVTRGYKGLYEATGGYRELRDVTEG